MEKDKKANNKLYRGASTVLNSQTSSKLKHYKFGSEIAYLQENGNYPAIMLPLKKIDFQFNREIDRIRFVNKFRLHMI
ncbi:hypothetical protein TYRP_022005 [Tyrophagus putrescentiae]|nr:hypothetical protein TYRP_022005 [Tyrophagus putrescentiae]